MKYLSLLVLLLASPALAQTAVSGAFSWDHHTESSGTVITEVIPPLRDSTKVRVTSIVYTAGATAHDVVLMRALEDTATTAADAVSATVIDIGTTSFVGQTLAANDWLVIEHSDGTYGAYMVSSVSSLQITLSTGLLKAINSSADVFIMGAPSETYHSTFKSVASTRIEFADPLSGIGDSGYDDGTYDRSGQGDPVLIYSANGTNAGTMNRGSAVYVR